MQLLILLALCGSVVLVPVDHAEVTATVPKPLCDPQTPCAWSAYNKVTKQIIQTMLSNYCVCSRGLVCSIAEDDTAVDGYIHRCQQPDPDEDTTAR